VALCGRGVVPVLNDVLAALDDLHTREPSPHQWASVHDQARLLLLPYQQLDGLAAAEIDAATRLLKTLAGWT